MRTWLRVLGLFSLSFAAAGKAHAQTSTGLELALSGGTAAVHGETFRATGTVYEVTGLADLRVLAGAAVKTSIEVYTSNRWTEVARGNTTSNAGGQVVLEVLVPMVPLASPRLVVTVERASARRVFTFPLALRSPHRLDVLTDRARYEPGETMHVFMRAYALLRGAPLADQEVRIVVRDPSSRVVADERKRLRASGAQTADVVFPASSADGPHAITITVEGGPMPVVATHVVEVARRTTERLLVTAALEREIVAPGSTIRGTVTVRTPSGAEVRGATVTLTQSRGTPVTLTTGEGGVATFSFPAPLFLAGPFEAQTLDVRVTHPAHGALHTSAAYTLARTEWRGSAMAENRMAVPELPGAVFFEVTDLRGAPAPRGTRVGVSGPGIAPDTSVEVDADGFAEVPMRVPIGAAAPFSPASGCQGAGVTLVVDVTARTTDRTEVCVPVDREALVRPRVRNPVVHGGETITVDVARRAAVANAPVLLELLDGPLVVGSAFVEGQRAQGTITVPSTMQGFFVVRARPLGDTRAIAPISAEGTAMFGTGSTDGVLVRPSDAFGLSIEGQATPYPVRSNARVALHRTASTGDAWVTLVARDLAQHGGEADYAARFAGRFREQASAFDRADSRLLRSTLAAALPTEARASGLAPIVVPPWARGTHYRGAGIDTNRGELRDPLRIRDALLRARIGHVEVVLERALENETIVRYARDDGRANLLVRRGEAITGFDPRAVDALVDRHGLSSEAAETLGSGRMTLAMLEAADPALRFERVAARVARRRLMRLMLAVVRFSNPDDERATRASAGVPPERWLSRMIEIRMLPPVALTDPWGRSFAFRRTTGAPPRFPLSDRAPGFEVVSAGADGRFGTADDVRDPFARVVPEGTPYAVASGEDALMRTLSAMAPGASTLASMLRAYDTISLSAREETRGPRVTATEAEGEEVAYDFEDDAVSGELVRPDGEMLNVRRRALETSSSTRSIDFAQAQAQPPPSPAATVPMDPQAAQEPEPEAPATERSLARAGELVRERFPATLFFLGEVPLDGPRTHVEIPLADALTTYRVEAIAWTRSGWVTSARTEIRADQDATVDAPVPPFVTVGDEIRVPVRVTNRTSAPLDVKVSLESETDAATASGVQEVRVPPHDGTLVVVTAHARSEGEGALVARVVRASDGTPLDAARRPIRVLPDARLVRVTERVLREGPGPITLEIPNDATPRGPGAIRIATGFDFFGELPRTTPNERLAYGYLLAFAGLPEDAAITTEIAAMLRVRADGSGELPSEPSLRYAAQALWQSYPLELARAVGASARSRSVRDEDIVAALERLSEWLPETDDREGNPAYVTLDAEMLLALAPALDAGRSGETLTAIRATARRLRNLTANAAARIRGDAYVDAALAAALAVTAPLEGHDLDPRAEEILRRIEGDVIRVGDVAFLEEAASYGQASARIRPTAMLALARLHSDDREGASACLRALARVSRFDPNGRFLAALVLAKLTPGIDRPVTLVVDGTARAALTRENGALHATLPELGRPGEHTLELALPEGSLAWVELDVRYGRPWTATSAHALAVALEIDGPVGARDTRSGIAVQLRNQSPRTLRRPILEIDLPAGVELDEPTREALARVSAGRPTVESRTLRIPLRALAPGARVRVPLPLRFSVAGSLRGLGATLYDDVPTYDGARAFAVLPSRPLTIPDEGAEPAQAEPTAQTPEPVLPEPPPILRPLTP